MCGVRAAEPLRVGKQCHARPRQRRKIHRRVPRENHLSRDRLFRQVRACVCCESTHHVPARNHARPYRIPLFRPAERAGRAGVRPGARFQRGDACRLGIQVRAGTLLHRGLVVRFRSVRARSAVRRVRNAPLPCVRVPSRALRHPTAALRNRERIGGVAEGQAPRCARAHSGRCGGRRCRSCADGTRHRARACPVARRSGAGKRSRNRAQAHREERSSAACSNEKICRHLLPGNKRRRSGGAVPSHDLGARGRP